MNLQDVLRLSEDGARKLLEEIRWPNGAECPHCGEVGTAYPIRAGKARAGLYECSGCEKQFTVTVGTVMHKSKIPISKWIAAFHMICAHKKGVSSLRLQRDLGLGSYRTALHMSHRIRLAIREEPMASLLGGKVEVDETYVGGKPRNGAEPGRTGRGTKKTPVLALVERGGKARAMPVQRVNAKTLKGAIRENIDRSSTILTDEWAAYKGIGKEFEGGHQAVNHGAAEYARGSAGTNTVEAFFALLKRGGYGTFHHVSKQHLHRYCDEFSFRWNHRQITDGERTRDALAKVEGKRLVYCATQAGVA